MVVGWCIFGSRGGVEIIVGGLETVVVGCRDGGRLFRDG